MFSPQGYTRKAAPLIYSLAKEMLGEKDLDAELRDYLSDIETFANLSHGSIQSRQVVALALVHYLDRSTLLNKITSLEKDIQHLKDLGD